jgi:hypothetical protein
MRDEFVDMHNKLATDVVDRSKSQSEVAPPETGTNLRENQFRR